MSDLLRERMEEVYRASVVEDESAAAPQADPLERRWQEVAGYASLYFNDLYHKFPLARLLKKSVIAVTKPVLNEQVEFNRAATDVLFDLRRRLEESEKRVKALERRVQELEDAERARPR